MVEGRCVAEALCAVVVETVWGLFSEPAYGGAVPEAAIRGAIHRRRRVPRTLILGPVVQEEGREKGQIRHRKGFASRQPSPKATGLQGPSRVELVRQIVRWWEMKPSEHYSCVGRRCNHVGKVVR